MRVERRGWREFSPPIADVADGTPEVSVVLPCLNEAETLARCLETAKRALADHRIVGEIVVADNGSTDGSIDIALTAGVRIIAVEAKGYGSALMGGIRAARGRFVIMGDADASYDFAEIPAILAKLKEGFDLVQGCRLPAGGGRIEPGAMPVLHRLVGNPMLTTLARWWFGVPIHDIQCGLRGFDRAFWFTLDQHCLGMEFSSEMLIKAALKRGRISEVPITLHRDGRTAHPPHMRTFRDGWRNLRFYLLFSPRWLFLVPGLPFLLLGLVGYLLAYPGVTLGAATFDAHTLLFASLSILLGYQSVLFAVLTRLFGTVEGFLPEDPRFLRLFDYFNLERGILAGALAAVAGLAFLAIAVTLWYDAAFGRLDYGRTMRIVIPGVTLTALGVQTVLSSFLLSIIGLKRR
ncbi:MAG: glycosyltransferase family 2 protein [Gemmatimonadetes bacterium]|nr:glycosyltransferase family 2 protein [Gemmatimonadota bacterium]